MTVTIHHGTESTPENNAVSRLKVIDGFSMLLLAPLTIYYSPLTGLCRCLVHTEIVSVTCSFACRCSLKFPVIVQSYLFLCVNLALI